MESYCADNKLLYALVIILDQKNISVNHLNTAVGAGTIILDAGHKLLDVPDILFDFNNKVFDSFAILFNQLYTANGVSTILLDTGDRLLCVQVTLIS